MRRSLTIVFGCAVAVAATLGQASAAAANPPTIAVESIAVDTTLEGYCTFPVGFQFEQPKARTTTFYTQDGQVLGILATGAARATVTNTLTGNSLTFNISGPGKFDPATGYLTGYGPSIVGHRGSQPYLIVVAGQFVLFQGALVSSTGKVIDVCAALS